MLTLERILIQQGDFSLSANFTLSMGSICAIVGASGGGKSTLLSVISGFLIPAAGRVLIDDTDVTNIPPRDRDVSILFQDNNLFPHLTVTENIALGLRPSLRLNTEDMQRVTEVIHQVDLGGLEQRKPAALSGGQQSRVALARALLRGRGILLLDEPFSALGPALRIEMLDLVAKIATEGEITVLMVSHDPADALRIADVTAVVHARQVDPPQPTQALFKAPSPALRAYLGT